MSMKAQKTLLIFVFNILCFLSPQAHSALKNYISYDLEYGPFKRMLLKLEKDLGASLQNRGEAHITVVTPPEYATLLKKLTPEQIHAIANKILVKKPKYEHVCVGSGSLVIKHHEEKTYYMVMKAPKLLKIRQALAQASGLSVEQFNPDLFFPHVTLGFTLRDLHYEDGVIKDQNSCLKK